MIVSRETSLQSLLSKIAKSLNLNESILNEDLSFVGLTRPSLSLTLLALFKTINKTVFLIFDDNQISETLPACTIQIPVLCR